MTIWLLAVILLLVGCEQTIHPLTIIETTPIDPRYPVELGLGIEILP